MTTAWMLSSLAIAVLVGGAALCVEGVLTLRRGTPLRWTWITALIVSLGWSAVLLLPQPPATSSLAPISLDLVSLGSVAPQDDATRSRALPDVAERSIPIIAMPIVSERVDGAVRVGWVACSIAVLLAVLWSSLRLQRDRQRWRTACIDGTIILVSDGFGPAIVGLWRPAIVVPPWVLALDATTQRTILLHETEHRRAGDQWLLLASLAALVLTPWNVAIWLMGRRLARTIELDCDERVLSHGIADVEYANVLLNAWQCARTSMPWVPTPALAEHPSRLGRRVRHLMRLTPRRRVMKSIGGACASVLLLSAAVMVPRAPQAQTPTVTPLVQIAPVSTPPAPVKPTGAVTASSPAVRSSSRSATAAQPRPSAPTITVTALTNSNAQLQRARIAVIAPFDSMGSPVVRAVHERLVADAAGRALDVIAPREIQSLLTGAGFTETASLSARDVQAFGQLARADLVVLVQLDVGSAGLRMDASVGGGRSATLRPLSRGEGNAAQLSDQLLQALRTDSAYARLRRPMSELSAVAFRPAVVAPGSRGPAYPADLRESRVSGDVLARFVVDTSGRVDESTIAIVASDRPQFSVAVIESLRTTRFLAAERGGTKVSQPMQIAFRFVRDGTQTVVSFVTDDAIMRDIKRRFEARGRTGSDADSLRQYPRTR